MSIDFYPAILKSQDGASLWENVVPMEGNPERLCAAARMDASFEGEAFEANPDYIPFSSMNMCHSNAMYVLRQMGLKPDDTEECGELPIADVAKAAHESLFEDKEIRFNDQYLIERIFALREMARLGISRGATHIVWA